jgi:hypothetical protein
MNLIAELPDAPSTMLIPALLLQNTSSSSAQQTPSSQPAPSSAPQSTTPAPAAQTTTGGTDTQTDSNKQFKQETQQRMLGVIPAFSTVFGGSAPPLTPGQKFHLFFKSAVDPFEFVAVGIDAGLEQAQDSFPEYGQGMKGFAKRYGASYADSFDGNLFGNAILPSIFHQDPRYFRLGHGKIMKRVFYAAIASVRCKGDNGHWQMNYSNVAGNFIGGAISNAYYPPSDRGFGLTIQRGLVVTAEGAFGSEAVEFYPDVMSRLFHHKAKAAVPPPQAPAPSQP